MLMSRTRAASKLALRYCRNNEDMLRADACAKIWQIRTLNIFGAVLINIKMPVLVSIVGGCSGDVV